MNFLNNIKARSLLIVNDNNLKKKILKEITNKFQLINIKIMTLNEFSKHYFFDYNQETLYYLVKKYKISVKNAKIFLDNLKFIIKLEFSSEKVDYLKNIYNDLLKNNLLIIDNYFQMYLKNNNLIIINKEEFEPFYLSIFNNYKVSYYNILIKENNNIIDAYHLKNIEEEVSFIFNKISSLIKSGFSSSKIKLTNVTNEYESELIKFSNFYNLKLNNLKSKSIFETKIVQDILKLIKNKTSKEEILNYIFPFQDREIYLHIFNILNNYYFIDDLSQVYDLLIEDFKNTFFKSVQYSNAIDILPLNSYLFDESDQVFILGFNLENIPKIYQDLDYFNDDLKKQIGLFTSVELNKIEHDKIIKHIKNIHNLIITYKDNSPYQSYYPSNLLEELNLKILPINNINLTSNIYNKIKLTNNLDLLLKYGINNDETPILLNTYSNFPYLTYDNTFTKLRDFKLSKINLSYTSLNNFYQCAFRYYIDNILKLNIYDDTFKIMIGNLFHYILAKIFLPDFDFEKEYDLFLKDKKLSIKDEFYLNLLKDELKTIIKIIYNQHELSEFDKLLLEKEIKLTYQINLTFKGIIDKIMYKVENNNTYLSLIDYKTGILKTDMTNLKYGIDMQLPIYVYLIKKSNLFLNSKIIGFYLEQILPEKFNFDDRHSLIDLKESKLKLDGYSLNNEELISKFDKTYCNSKLIKSMKTTSKGFSVYTKLLSENAINNLVNIVDLKIKEAFNEIALGNFEINPKIINGQNLGCRFCSYQDLCFKTGKDLKYLNGSNDLSYLESGDANAKLD